MKITEDQIFGNITTIEQELLYLILLELRGKKPHVEAPVSDLIKVVDTIEPTEKPVSKTVKTEETKPKRKRAAPKKKKPTK